MGCVTATAKRRRKQAVNGYRHMHPMRRPHFPIPNPVAAQRREAKRAATRARMIATSRKVRPEARA